MSKYANDVLTRVEHHHTDAVNRITSRVVDEAPGGITPDPIPFVHDAAGNLTDDGDKTFKYDAWNRIVEVNESVTPIATYKYDAIGRLINKQVFNSGPLNTTGTGDFFYYDGHRDLEHYKDDGTNLSLHREYIYGLDYIDEVTAFYDGGGTLHFVLQDANYNIVGVADTFGGLEQQYSYKPYGERLLVEDENGASIDFENFPDQLVITKGHQGLNHMPEIDGVYNRGRILRPNLGRYYQRDSNETSLLLHAALASLATSMALDSTAQFGGQYADGMSLYQYARSNPINQLDPSGRLTLFGVIKTVSYRVFLGYIAYDTATTMLSFVRNIISAFQQRNFTQSMIFDLALDSLSLGADFAVGPGLKLLRKFGVPGVKKGKAVLGALAEIGERRRAARRIIGEVTEEGLELAIKQGHHMIPKQVLDLIKKQSPEVYKAVVGKAGEKNIWKIPTKLHTWMHGEKFLGAGGWWNKMWLDAWNDMARVSGNLSPEQIIANLKTIRNTALSELGIDDLLKL